MYGGKGSKSIVLIGPEVHTYCPRLLLKLIIVSGREIVLLRLRVSRWGGG